MLTAVSLCFGKTALLHTFGSKHFASALPPSQGDRYYSAYCIYNHYYHYPSYPLYRFFPCILAIPPIGGLFRLTPFRLSLRQKPIRFFRADATKNREPSDLTPDYSFQADAFSILIEAKAFPIIFEAEDFPFLSG